MKNCNSFWSFLKSYNFILNLSNLKQNFCFCYRDLGENRIQAIDHHFDNLKSLTILWVKSCFLVQLFLPFLKTLFSWFFLIFFLLFLFTVLSRCLRSNSIREIGEFSFFRNRKLVELDLGFNGLTAIKSKTFHQLKFLSELWVIFLLWKLSFPN